MNIPPCVIIRGGGDLASGIALRLHHCGFPVVITELERPLAVRRLVSFAEAVYTGKVTIEGVVGKLVHTLDQVSQELVDQHIPVLADPEGAVISDLHPPVVVDARMTKKIPQSDVSLGAFRIGLGPGFEVGVNCEAVIETQRGPFLGRVYWTGTAAPDTGLPETVGAYQGERVLRAPADGVLTGKVKLGAFVRQGEIIAEVNGKAVVAQFDGYVRGLLHDGMLVQQRLKIGDLDPRKDGRICQVVSDKALAVGGGVLEAILAREDLRRVFCC